MEDRCIICEIRKVICRRAVRLRAALFEINSLQKNDIWEVSLLLGKYYLMRDQKGVIAWVDIKYYV